MKSITALSDLKLRVSYGELGNNAIGNYDWQSIYSSANYASGSDLQSGIAITSIANNALRWESTAVANIGLDYAFLNDRLTGTVDVYNKLTSGILYTPDMFMAWVTHPHPSRTSLRSQTVVSSLSSAGETTSGT